MLIYMINITLSIIDNYVEDNSKSPYNYRLKSEQITLL